MASRKAGRSEYTEPLPENPLRKKLIRLAWLLQGGALGFLVYETGRLYLSGFENTDFDIVIVYAAIFFIGRFMHIGISFMK